MIGGNDPIPPPTPSDGEQDPSSSRNAGPEHQMLEDNLFDPVTRQVLDQDLTQSFLEMRAFVHWREHHIVSEQQPSSIDSEQFHFLCWRAQYLATSQPFTNQSGSPHPLQEPCRIAALVFWNASTQINLPGSMIYRTLASQLTVALHEAPCTPFIWEHCHDILIWILLLGAFITEGQSENQWFIMEIAHGMEYTSTIVLSWKQVEDIVTRFLYIDRVFAMGFESTWDRVLALSENLV